MPGLPTDAAFFERLVSMTPAILFAADAAGTWTFLSPAWTTVTGFAVEESLGRPCLEVIDPADHERWPSLTAKGAGRAAVPHGTPCRRELRIRTRDGGLRWVELHAVANYGSSGRLEHLHGTMIDVTERKRSEEALRWSERRVHDFASAASDWFWEMDAGLRFTYFSERMADLLGSDPTDLLGKTRQELTSETTADPKWQAHFEDLAARRPFRDFEYRHRNSGGDIRYILTSAKPVFSADGAFLGYRGVAADVTAQRLAEAALRETQARARRAEQLLAEAIESLSEGFILLDAERRFVLCNRRYRELYPTLVDHLVPGTPYATLMQRFYETDTDLPPDQWNAVLAARLNADADQYVAEQKTRSGRWTRISDYRTKDGGIVGIRTDITLAKQHEEALRAAKDAAETASRSKSAFLASMSHELRTPLNAIIGFSDLLAAEFSETVGEPVFTEYIDDIRRSGRHLLALINDILDVARFEAGRLDLDEEPLDLGRVIAESVRLTQHAFASDSHRLDVSVPNPAPVLVGDRRRLKQVMINLLGNALKFTPEGGRVGVGVAVARDALIITVTDTGIGIQTDRLAHVGQPFIQLDEALTRRYPGSGLGLHISRALVEQHGGSLAIESQSGVGTTVTVRLPTSRLLAAVRRA
ncbi:PAS domain S-box protein [Azospirillum soli]|uniref:sensor histidine kinase n=1 Tax=Azospirillum soli TaxID=1304799 RepID=UPI001AE5D001|nr:PAS domain S-box protein [Azospirillum soli]MBP2311256.1 PAS domain S-box-containing protein [Azospirillum soli]